MGRIALAEVTLGQRIEGSEKISQQSREGCEGYSTQRQQQGKLKPRGRDAPGVLKDPEGCYDCQDRVDKEECEGRSLLHL